MSGRLKWYNNGMLARELVTWWYSRGWKGVWRHTARATGNLSRAFSMMLLMRTLFAPWRQIITYPGASLDAKMRAYADNAVSRLVGFAVRIIVLVAALASIGVTMVAGTILGILWPLVPLAAVALIIKGIIG